jgi:hypothetical protein
MRAFSLIILYSRDVKKKKNVCFLDSGTEAKEPPPVPAKRSSLTKRDSDEDFVTVNVGRMRIEPGKFFSISTFDESKTDYKNIAKAFNAN